MILHAGCVARRCARSWEAVLITGPSGAGKSDLALRLIARGWRLVADDRTRVWVSGGRVYASAPGTLNGLLEARGVGVLELPPLALAPLALVIECLPPGEAAERHPDPAVHDIVGVVLPSVAVNALESSTTVKLELALARASGA